MVVHLVCYRRYGHNEGDEPAFTQPLMYDKVKSHPTTRDIYVKELVQANIIPEVEPAQMLKSEMDRLQSILDAVHKTPPNPPNASLDASWKGLRSAKESDFEPVVATGVEASRLRALGTRLNSWPSGFHIHKKLQQIIEKRESRLQKDGEVDRAMAELLAYGTELESGIPVRLTGQDVERGTFSHRQADWVDTENGDKFSPMTRVAKASASSKIHNSLL